MPSRLPEASCAPLALTPTQVTASECSVSCTGGTSKEAVWPAGGNDHIETVPSSPPDARLSSVSHATAALPVEVAKLACTCGASPSAEPACQRTTCRTPSHTFVVSDEAAMTMRSSWDTAIASMW